MVDITVRLEPQAESRCGFDGATVVALWRLEGNSAFEQIMQGLVFPRAADMCLRAPIDPLELALQVRHELEVSSWQQLLFWQRTLDRVNAAIVARDKERAAHETARQGTRSTRRHGKKRGGR